MADERQTIQLGISTCPNDTYTFHAILNNLIDTEGLTFEIDLLDVEQLNRSLLAGKYDVAKASFHAALKLTRETIVLPTGSALGFGVGPVLLSHQDELAPESFFAHHERARVLCPGANTTATLLFQLFHQGPAFPGEVDQVVFSDIMPALKKKRADFGVCIHEGRFSFQDDGLHCIEDLGATWEKQTECPLPLGGILGRRNLGNETLEKVQRVFRRSLEYSHSNRDETLTTMRQHAQEFSDDVLFAHVDLYVNDWTMDLSELGRAALQRLSQIAREMKLIQADDPGIHVL